MKAKKSSPGMAATQTLMILTAAGAVGILAFWLVREQTRAHQCVRNLKHIYQAIELYEIDHGRLPSLALYPNDPQHGSDSLLVALYPYGVEEHTGICPGTPPFTREQGLSYIWNIRLNGQSLSRYGEPKWMLIGINALSDRVRAPHLRGHHVLYTDGTVRAYREPPPGVREVLP